MRLDGHILLLEQESSYLFLVAMLVIMVTYQSRVLLLRIMISINLIHQKALKTELNEVRELTCII